MKLQELHQHLVTRLCADQWSQWVFDSTDNLLKCPRYTGTMTGWPLLKKQFTCQFHLRLTQKYRGIQLWKCMDTDRGVRFCIDKSPVLWSSDVCLLSKCKQCAWREHAWQIPSPLQFSKSRCCCNETPPMTEWTLWLFYPHYTENQQSCLWENSVRNMRIYNKCRPYKPRAFLARL